MTEQFKQDGARYIEMLRALHRAKAKETIATQLVQVALERLGKGTVNPLEALVGACLSSMDVLDIMDGRETIESTIQKV